MSAASSTALPYEAGSTDGHPPLAGVATRDVYYVVRYATHYVIDGHSEIALVDCGSPEDLEAVLEHIGTWGLDAKRVTKLINTHRHGDHAGGDRYAREKLGVAVMSHELDAAAIERGNPFFDSPEAAMGNLVCFDPCPVDVRLVEGASFRVGDHAVQVLHAPGHTPGSVVFLLKTDRTLAITGDVLFPPTEEQGVMRTWGALDAHWGSNLEDHLRTYERLAQVEAELILPGHFFPFRDLKEHVQIGLEAMRERMKYPLLF